jgi:hypothetical protein
MSPLGVESTFMMIVIAGNLHKIKEVRLYVWMILVLMVIDEYPLLLQGLSVLSLLLRDNEQVSFLLGGFTIRASYLLL